MNRKHLLLGLILVCSATYLAGAVYYASTRPLDGDEGYYVSAARLVWEGRVLYRDFTYPQAPLLPYLYSWVWAVQPHSIVAMRIFSAVCGTISVLLWGLALASARRIPTGVALATFAVILLNPYWFSWNVVVKTFALADLFMTVAALCAYAAVQSQRPRWFLVFGAAVGACASVRGLYGPLVPAVFVWLVYREWRASAGYRKTLAFCAGAIGGLLPIILSVLIDRHAFTFNNFAYRPLLESYGSFLHAGYRYASIALSLAQAPYFMGEAMLAAIGGFSLLKLRGRADSPYTSADYEYFQLAVLMLVVYTGTALVPFPPFEQYFDAPLTPFLLPFVAVGLEVVFRRGRKWELVFAILAPLLFLHDAKRDAWECSGPPVLQLSSYRSVTRAVEANSSSGDVVLSFWPGYVFESGRRYFPGAENKFNFWITGKMSPQDRARYHVVSKDDVVHAASAGAVKIIVTYPAVFDGNDRDLTSAQLKGFRTALNSNYSLVERFDDGVGVYLRR